VDGTPPKPWYKKKRYIIPGALIGGLVVLGSIGSGSTPTPIAVPLDSQSQSASVEEATLPTPSTATPTVSNTAAAQLDTSSGSTNLNQAPSNATQTDNLSNDNYYTNSAGNEVHSPAYAPSVPAGATAQCRDGTYSFSQSRRGTCSHHGGVAQWL
jgi:hypothetical protein